MPSLVDMRAEHAVLTSLLVRPSCWPDVSAVVTSDSFGGDRERLIASAVWSVRRRDDPIDHVTLRSELERTGGHSAVGLVAELADGIAPHAPERHARRVRDLHAARRTWELLGELAERATKDAESEPVTWLEDVARRVAAATDINRESDLSHVSELISQHVRQLESRAKGVARGIPTGIRALDAMTGGIHVGDYLVIAARPSCGKSALALQLAVAAAQDEKVAFFSSEMKSLSVMDRLVAERGAVTLSRVRDGKITKDEMSSVISAYQKLKGSGVWISDRRGWRVNEIVSQVRQWKRQHVRPRADGTIPKAVVIIDYLQLIRASVKHASREQEVAEVSWTLSTLAGEEQVAVVVLAQLSREAERRHADIPPQLSDLRESGSIEQDADGVWMLHRPDRIDPAIEKGASVLAIAKQRNGECGAIPLWFQGSQQRFVYREREYVRGNH